MTVMLKVFLTLLNPQSYWLTPQFSSDLLNILNFLLLSLSLHFQLHHMLHTYPWTATDRVNKLVRISEHLVDKQQPVVTWLEQTEKWKSK